MSVDNGTVSGDGEVTTSQYLSFGVVYSVSGDLYVITYNALGVCTCLAVVEGIGT